MEEYDELLSADCPGDIAEVYAGRCVFLTQWYDRPRSTKPGKADCEIMNELCRTLEQLYDT